MAISTQQKLCLAISPRRFVLLLMILLCACTQKREVIDSQPYQNPTTLPVANASIETYSYPHPSDWSMSHIPYFARNGKAIQGTIRDCNSCHQGLQIQGPPLRATCTTSCHASLPPRQAQEYPPANPTHAPPVANNCTTCHANVLRQPRLHQPALSGQCTFCHAASPSHITSGTRGAVSTLPVEQSCLSCHNRADLPAHPHQEASRRQQSCTSCHNPHGSPHPAFLKTNLEQTCIACHTRVVPEGSQSVHGVIRSENSCLSCHDPGDTHPRKLLANRSGPQMCLSCHNQPIQTVFSENARIIPDMAEKLRTSAGRSPHPAALDGSSCLNCHNPHASSSERLTSQSYVSRPYSRYEPGDRHTPNTYALCFRCHSTSLLSETATGNENKFRNDIASNGSSFQGNLHWFHVVVAAGGTNRAKGRSCFACHDPHGAEQAHNIRSFFPMSPSYNAEIRFNPRPDGGECTTSCHGPRGYSRSP